MYNFSHVVDVPSFTKSRHVYLVAICAAEKPARPKALNCALIFALCFRQTAKLIFAI